MMLQKVQTYIQKHQLLQLDKPVVVGVSGGTDSVVLLHLLVSLGYDCVVAHCNFHLRMEESDRDEEFVRSLASFYSVPFYKADFQTFEYAEEHRISIEMAARELRYNWFARLMEDVRAQAVAVAHHADDSIETLLINLVRGTGLRGLTGILPRNNQIVRPLLCCTRPELENYLTEHGLDHVEDSTNAFCDYRRNKIRNKVLPLLEEINPSVRQTLYANLKRFEGASAIYEQAVSKVCAEIIHVEDDVVKLSIEQIKAQLHIPTIMYELLTPYNFSPKVIEQVNEHLDGESGKMFYSETHQLLKDREFLVVATRKKWVDSECVINQNDSEVFIPFRMEIKRMKVDGSFRISREQYRIHVDASKIKFPLVVREWREGDTFFPFGMNKKKKLSDFFIDNKISRLEKDKIRLMLSGDDIVWVVGWRVDNRFRVSYETSDVLEFSIDHL